jgi:hypothetical protein
VGKRPISTAKQLELNNLLTSHSELYNRVVNLQCLQTLADFDRHGRKLDKYKARLLSQRPLKARDVDALLAMLRKLELLQWNLEHP